MPHDLLLGGNIVGEIVFSTRYSDNFQGVSKKYAELVKGKLSHHGDVDLTKYYIVSQEIIQYRMSQTEGRWSVQVSLALPLHITDYHICFEG